MRSHLANRKDENHYAVIGWYEELGCTVQDTSDVGFGFPDLIVGCCGEDDLVEVKTWEGRLLPSQSEFNNRWRGRKPRVVRELDDVIVHVQVMRKRSALRVPEQFRSAGQVDAVDGDVSRGTAAVKVGEGC